MEGVSTRVRRDGGMMIVRLGVVTRDLKLG